MGSPYNSFDIGSQNYETYSGALLFDEGPVFSDRYAFAFQDGTITINSISIDYAGETAQIDLMYTISDGTTRDCSKRCVQIILLDFQLVESQEERNLCASVAPRETHIIEHSRRPTLTGQFQGSVALLKGL